MTSLVEPLLELLEKHTIDFTSTLRLLTHFPKVRADDLIERILDNSTMCDLVRATDDLEAWLAKYKARLADGGAAAAPDERRRWNPRFCLRQWVLEEAIARAQGGKPDARHHLARVLDVSPRRAPLPASLRLKLTLLSPLSSPSQMATRPFEPWGREGEEDVDKLTDDEREERRLCELGDDDMLGAQCSCSS